MVIYAYLRTSITQVVPHEEDAFHDVYRTRFGLQLKNLPKPAELHLPEGTLYLGNIQIPERNIVKALAGDHDIRSGQFIPWTLPYRGDYSTFPTLFELERITAAPFTIYGIDRISSDGVQDFSSEHSYRIDQEQALQSFLQEYVALTKSSPTGKPVMEGFYRLFKETSRRSYIPFEDFERSFGTELLREFQDRIQ